MQRIHQRAITDLAAVREQFETALSPMVINGAIGPQDDGYNPSHYLTVATAEVYHTQQIRWFTEYGTDMISAITMTYVEKAIGITSAAKRVGIPCAISFTVKTDGRLPSGQSLRDAIEIVDQETDRSPTYYMINCAHPEHFLSVLDEPGPWRERIRGVRANASRMSHEELDNAETLDKGNPRELAEQIRAMHQRLPNLVVSGGCCGTDRRHINAISRALDFAEAAESASPALGIADRMKKNPIRYRSLIGIDSKRLWRSTR